MQEFVVAFLWTDASFRHEFLAGYGTGSMEWKRMLPLVETFLALKLLEYYAWNKFIGEDSVAEPMSQSLISML